MKTYISDSYDLIYQFKTHNHIQVDRNGNIINTLTNRKKRIVVNGRSKGLWLDSKTFITYKNLNDNIEKIKKQHCPF